MAKINLYKILQSLETDRDFKDRLRAGLLSLAPDIDLTRDQVLDAVMKGFSYYKDHTLRVPDTFVEKDE